MNERLKTLADEAANYAAITALPTGKSGDELFVQKFAELIIQDFVACCAVVAQTAINARDTVRDDEFEYWYGREDAANLCKTAIKRHFEVECDETAKNGSSEVWLMPRLES